MQKFIQDQLIILRKFPINESDLLIVGLTKTHGKILVKVKGEKKLNSQFKGKINIFNLLSVQIYDSGKSLTLTEANLIATGPDGTDLSAFHFTQEICKLLNSLLPDSSPTPDIFDFIASIIKSINTCPCNNLIYFFITNFLHLEGYLSPIKPPENITKLQQLFFYVDSSGNILPTTDPHFENPFLFTPNTIKVINFFLKSNFQTSSKLNLSEESQEELTQCLKQIYQNNIHSELRINPLPKLL